MIGYTIRGLSQEDHIAGRLPERLRRCRPQWQSVPCAGGIYVTWPGTSPDAGAYGEPRETDDGMLYHPPLVRPTIYDLARPDIPESVEVDLSLPWRVSVALGICAPRLVMLGASSVTCGDPATAFGLAAHQLWQSVREDETGEMDAEQGWRVIFLAIQQCYYVSEELFSDLGIFTDADFLRLIQGVCGIDPKSASGDEPA